MYALSSDQIFHPQNCTKWPQVLVSIGYFEAGGHSKYLILLADELKALSTIVPILKYQIFYIDP
jgi:hypothetical protein